MTDSFKWLIVGGAFLCYLLTDGCTFSIGVIYSELLDVFPGTKAQAAVLPGLIYGIPMLSGPFVCPLVDTLGSSISATMGGLLLFASFFISSFMSQFLHINLILGVFASVGLELVYVSAIVCVSVNFTKHLGLATGLTVAGSGVGIFLFNPLLSNMIRGYSWRGAMMIESALFLHILIAASLFYLVGNELKYRHNKRLKSNGSTTDNKIELVKVNHTIHVETEDELSCELPSSPVQRLYSSESNLLDAPRDSLPPEQARPLKYRPSHLLGQLRASDSLPFVNPGPGTHSTFEDNSTTPKLTRRLTDASSNGDQASKTCPHKLPIDTHGGGLIKRVSERGGWVTTDDSNEEQRYISRHDTSSFRHGRDTEKSPLYHRSCDLLDMKTPAEKADTNDAKAGTPEGDNESINDVTVNPCWKNFLRLLSKSLRGLIARDIWQSWRFLLFCCMMVGVSGSMVVPFTFTYDRAIGTGIEAFWASFLLSLIGIASTIGQVLFGLLADHLSPLILLVSSCLLMAASLILMSLTTSYTLLCFIYTIYGFSQSAAYSLYTLIFISLLGADRLYAALGIYLPIIGATTLVTTPLAGYVYDLTGSYDLSFVLAGCVVFVSCLFSVPLIVFELRSKRIITCVSG